MNSTTKMTGFIVFIVASVWQPSAATTIDPFTASQGPFTISPGEEISEEQALLETDSVFGGVRVLVPDFDEAAGPQSVVTVEVANGELLCELTFPRGDPENDGGACGTSYIRREGPFFDLTAVESFEVEVLEASGSALLVIVAEDRNGVQTSAASEVNQNGPVPLSAGTFSRSRAEFTTFPSGQPFDWSNVDSLIFAIGNFGGLDARVRLDEISITGSIGFGDPGPPPETELSDEELSDTISGNYFNPNRSGEGCMLTREGDLTAFILTCYVYRDGEQAWLIGVGLLENGGLDFFDVVVTRGTGYGADFDSDQVERVPFGDVQMNFVDCNEAVISMDPTAEGFIPVQLQMQRIVPVACEDGIPSAENALRVGNWFNPMRDGEGFQLAVEGNGDLHILTFYTYLDGEQLWMIGTGMLVGDVIEFNDMHITRGTGFGPAFDAEEVERILFGKITMQFEDCNNATIQIESILPQFPDIETDVTRIVEGPCEL